MAMATCAQCGAGGLADGHPRTGCPTCGSTARIIGAGTEENANASDTLTSSVHGAAQILESGDATAACSASVRHNFSVLHLLSAARFSQQLRELEQIHAGETWGPFSEEIFACASATVMLAVAALEAYANEFFKERTKLFSGVGTSADDARNKYRRMSPLERYKYASELLDFEFPALGSPLCQQIKALIELRNGLTHFKPEWDTERVSHAKVEELLRGKIDRSPFLPPTESLFPLGWVSHNCAAWAVRSTVRFILEFERLSGVEGRLETFGDRFSDDG